MPFYTLQISNNCTAFQINEDNQLKNATYQMYSIEIITQSKKLDKEDVNFKRNMWQKQDNVPKENKQKQSWDSWDKFG